MCNFYFPQFSIKQNSSGYCCPVSGYIKQLAEKLTKIKYIFILALLLYVGQAPCPNQKADTFTAFFADTAKGTTDISS